MANELALLFVAPAENTSIRRRMASSTITATRKDSTTSPRRARVIKCLPFYFLYLCGVCGEVREKVFFLCLFIFDFDNFLMLHGFEFSFGFNFLWK